MVNCSLLHFTEEPGVLYTMQAVIFVVNFAFTIAVTCIRYGHPGKVCSGDYLFTEPADDLT